MILLIDNYDSFTYNLFQYFSELGQKVEVFRNDKITIDEIKKMNPEYIVISPGPKTPQEAGLSVDIIKEFYKTIPILGVCLGHQCLAYAFGSNIIKCSQIVHGKVSNIYHQNQSIFKNIPNPFKATRYHSLIVEKESLSSELEIIAQTDDNIIMALRHKEYKNVIGVQFHPESILTDAGKKILFNFVYKENKEGIENDFKFFINKVVDGNNLIAEEAKNAMEIIMNGAATSAQIASFLTALRLKGETDVEIAELAKVMREKAAQVKIDKEPVIDTCGTGGDRSNTFNISTISAFVVAAAGGIVAKHGNKSVSSKCGSADLLQALGVNIDLDNCQVEKIINKIGIGFMFAPKMHAAMKYAIGPRREMAIRTVFNILGPLTNPAFAKHQVIGVYDLNLTEKLGNVLNLMNTKHSFVVASLDGLDEISLSGSSKITEVNCGNVNTFYFKPEEYGFDLCSLSDLQGGSIIDNANIAKNILSGTADKHKTNAVIINAGFAVVAGNIVSSFKDAFQLCSDIIYSKKAYHKLQELIEETNTFKS